MRPPRKVSESLVNDIVAVAAHQTEEVKFLRAALEIASRAALAGLCRNDGDSHRAALAQVKLICDEALSMQGGAE